ncbi:urease accessory protein UreF [Calidifontibacter sp. DB0510]|uniref:Urease accessory protein UreF n=1 Tax=Metallococcus carri TaxID=1656884 RepID=A0A967E9I9_9MICO|nr:urease accessory UreF family protein [Metallococcus carri]NHN55245.1 urease accessory protein UreF [Metallococcus carri]NOP36322.1 urease accessory protein UreF [Calidifontibacter sp. DB2511S]
MSGIAALLLADARLPAGGHTQSAGLEPALLGGLEPTDIPGFLRTRLATSARVDAATAVVTRAGAPVEQVLDAWAARTPSEVVRAAAVEAGRGYLRLARTLGMPTSLLPRDTPRPIALGSLARDLGLAAAEVARVAIYDDLQTACAAALKLAPMDPATPVGWLLACADPIDEAVADVAKLTEPQQIPATTAPLMELWQHAHSTATRRLFRA